MRVKTFRGESITAVLAQVRQELGPEAVILSNQTIREEGASLCEVMAALEQPTPPPSPPQQEEETGSIAALYRQAAQPVSPTSPGQTADWKREWGEIKGHLLALLRPRLDFSALTPRQRLALEYLEREGVDEGSVLALYRTIIERGEQTVIPALSRLVRVKALTTESWPRTAHMFVGPSGVGKTSTVLRMALAARRRAPEERVLVVNTDTTRSKGRLLLRHYAELSGLSYEEANGPEDFKRIFEAAAKGETVFVDTPSLCGEGAIAEWSLEMGLAGRKGLAAHLVLSPMYSSAHATHMLRVNRCEHLASLVWTKLDEACNYGSLVNMAHASSLPVSALAFGPELTSGMVPASGKAVWKLLFKHQLPGDYPDADAGA